MRFFPFALSSSVEPDACLLIKRLKIEERLPLVTQLPWLRRFHHSFFSLHIRHPHLFTRSPDYLTLSMLPLASLPKELVLTLGSVITALLAQVRLLQSISQGSFDIFSYLCDYQVLCFLTRPQSSRTKHYFSHHYSSSVPGPELALINIY